MKLKLRADAKDWVIFSIFCVALLYLSAIAVLNLSEFSKYGTFVACGNYPTCKYVKKEKKEVEYVGRKCPDCGSELVYRTSKKGKFIACSGFPKCRHMESIPDESTSEN